MRIFIIVCSLVFFCTCNATITSKKQQSEFLLSLYNYISNSKVPASSYNKFFTKNATANVEGKELGNLQLRQHLKFLRANTVKLLSSNLISVKQKNILAVLMTANFSMKDKKGKISNSRLRFFSFYFLTPEGKIKRFEETSYPLDKKSDNAIGSKY